MAPAQQNRVAEGEENRYLARVRIDARVPTGSEGEELDRESTEEGATLAAGKQFRLHAMRGGIFVCIALAGRMDADQRQLRNTVESFKASRAQQAKLLLSVLNAAGAIRRTTAGTRAVRAYRPQRTGHSADAAILRRAVRAGRSAVMMALCASTRRCALSGVPAAAVHAGARLS